MTIEEFYNVCENAVCKTIFEVWSYFTPLYEDKFDAMPKKIRNLHVATFYVKKGCIIVKVRECVR